MKNDQGESSKPGCYFYVVIPPEDQAVSNDCSSAVTNSKELQAIMKRNPGARFMAASTAEEAMKKALERIQFSKDTESIMSPPAQPPKRKGRQSFSAVEASIGAPAVESPKTAELLMMGREILAKKNEQVFERIDKNPRILCTDSEFPTILQEGCKYNAVHLAAKSNNFDVLRRILNLASSVDFFRRIYPNQSEDNLLASCKHLANCYLNSPDKMSQETPLHFACKFNAVECVEILLSHPFCDTSLRNFEKLTAFEIIGTRDEPKGAKASAVRKAFGKRYIVPIWRDLIVDGDPPVLGEICYIPDLGQSIPDPLLRTNFPDFSIQLLEGCKPKLFPKASSSSIKVFTSKPVSWKIQAFAGPMEENKAKEFRRVMKRSRYFLFGFPSSTPDTSLNISISGNFGNGENTLITPPGSPTTSYPLSPRTPPQIRSPLSRLSFCDSPVIKSPLRTDMAVRVRDAEKGLERIASEYCEEMEIPFTEYWKFLGAFCDLSSNEGLNMLEEHFRDLESRRSERSEEKEDNKDLNQRSTSSFMDDVIYKFQEIRLSESGMSTPEKKDGNYCTNPNCRMESRFCNCEDVVPHIPYEDDDDFDPVVFTYGDEFKENVPFQANFNPLQDIRKLDISSNSDSFNVSNPFKEAGDLDWPGHQIDPEGLECYKTAPSSPAEAEKDLFEECENVELYLSGDEPGKLDFQVFQILCNADWNIDPYKHLLTFQWLNSMRSYGKKIISTFQTQAMGTPNKPWGPSFSSTPCRGQTRHLNFDESFS